MTAPNPDILPKLKAKIEKTFQDLVNDDEVLSSIRKKIKTGTASYDEAHDFAGRLAQLRSQALKAHLSAETLPDGKLYWNIAQRLLPPEFKADSERVSDMCVDIQSLLNEAAGIGIEAQAVPFNEDRAKGIVDRISSEPFSAVSWLLEAPIETMYRAAVDEHVKANADFQFKAGLSPKIVRTSTGRCCKWCTSMAGTYDYSPDMNRDVFRRHKNCRCKTVYYPGDGKKVQNVWTKNWEKGKVELPDPVLDPAAAPLNHSGRNVFLEKIEGLSEADQKAVLTRLENAGEPFQKAFDYVDDLSSFRLVSGREGRYAPCGNWIQFGLKDDDYVYEFGVDRYTTVFHEYGHFISHRGRFEDLHFRELDALSQLEGASAYGKTTCADFFTKTASASDEFLEAVRKDRVFLQKKWDDWDPEKAPFRMSFLDAISFEKGTTGPQDALDGFFSTMDNPYNYGRTKVGHGDEYYNRLYEILTIYKVKSTAIKKAYKTIGIPLKRKGEVIRELRLYAAAEEIWANVNAAYIVRGAELEKVLEYLPNTSKTFLEIMERLKKYEKIS